MRLAIFVIVLFITGCADPNRMGMVRQPGGGLQAGSTVSHVSVIDSSQFDNKRLKLRIRNVSGDPAFDLTPLRETLLSSYRAAGYSISEEEDFGLLLDITVRYSGQFSSDMTAELGVLGAVAGGIAGYRSNAVAGSAIGIVSGATLGAIAGSYVTTDTYIVIAEATIAVVDPLRGKTESSLSFGGGSSTKKKKRSNYNAFRESDTTTIAVYAGGRSTPQSAIVSNVRSRFERILRDLI